MQLPPLTMPAAIFGAYHLPSIRAWIITLLLYLELPFIGGPPSFSFQSAFLHLAFATCVFLPCYLHQYRTLTILALFALRLFITHPYITALAVAIVSAAKFFIIPILTRFFPNLHLRAATISLRGGRAIEWRKDENSLEPDIFLERIGVEVDRRDPKSRRLAIVLKGLVIRVKPSQRKTKREFATERQEDNSAAPEERRSSATRKWMKALAAQILHFGIQHWRLPSLVTLHLYDVRIILEDLQLTEIAIAEVQSSLEITFKSSSSDGDKRYDERDCPLAPPCNDNGEPIPVPGNTRFTRVGAAAWSKANRGWFRMIGRSHGTTTLTTRLRDIEVVHPDKVCQPQTLGTKASKEDLGRKLSKTLRPLTTNRNSSFVSLASLHSRVRAPSSTTYSQSSADGYLRLLVLRGEQTVAVSMAFGPRRGLLGEDTLSASIDLSELVTSVQALERVKDIGKARNHEKLQNAKKTNDWTPTSLPRIVLRAIESISLSVERASVSHHVPSPFPEHKHSNRLSSASSYVTNFADAVPDSTSPDYTLTVYLARYKLKVSAADSSNNRQARYTYGTNQSRESRVRGVGVETSFADLEIQCVAPWETTKEKSQLLALRGLNLEALSTWRPPGWCREELLFATDPNLAILVASAHVSSVDVSAELSLIKELKEAFLGSHADKPAADADIPPLDSKPDDKPLPPRIRVVLDVKHISIVLADRESSHQTTLSVVTDGFSTGAFTNYVDLVARRRDRNASKVALKDEEHLYERRLSSDLPASDYIFPSRLKPQLRRRFNPMVAHLADDLSFALQGNAFVTIEPVEVHMSLSDTAAGPQQRTFDMLKLGKVAGVISGDVLGRSVARSVQPHHPSSEDSDAPSMSPTEEIPPVMRRVSAQNELDSLPTCVESHHLVKESLSCDLDLSVEQGIKMELWDMDVLQAIVDLGSAGSRSTTPSTSTHTSPTTSPSLNSASPRRDILSRIPSGVAARLNLGDVSIFLGREDPNPDCGVPLTRGLWLYFDASLEYAYYQHKMQSQPSRHYLSAPARHKLDLPEDVVVQALALANHYAPKDGRAAVFTLGMSEVSVRPVFNGKRFIERGGTSMKPPAKDIPLPTREPEDRFSDWAFMRKPPPQDLRRGVFANNVPPLDQSNTDQAHRALFRLPRGTCTCVLSAEMPTAEVELKLTSKLHTVTMVGDLSHIYCVLVSAMAIEDIIASWRHVSQTPTLSTNFSSRQLVRSVEISVNALRVHIALPLGEQVFLAAKGLNFKQISSIDRIFNIDSTIIYVPSPLRMGSWEELSRLRKLSVAIVKTQKGPAISLRGIALRVRIPFSYQMSKLVLNVNVALKSVKKLLLVLKGREFSTVQRPVALPAKKVPDIDIHFDAVSLEAKDSPIEARLNLAMRVGLIEQEARLELDETFRLKAMLIAEADESARLNPSASHHKTDSHSRLSSKATISVEEAEHRLQWLKSQMWIPRIRTARNEQRRREELLIRGTFGSKEGEARLPIHILPPQASAPLFRASCNGFDMSLRRPPMSEGDLLQYMSDISDPFDKDTKFTIMLPVQLSWSMDSLTCTLRDYPLPLVRINPCPPQTSAKRNDHPSAEATSRAWQCETTLIFAEELAGDDSFFLIDSMVIPAGCGAAEAPEFKLQIAKTLMPVKTYGRPLIKIGTSDTTDFTWGNSYQPAIQDFMKVIESLSHPPRDPSTRVGFWDKLRLVLHWVVDVQFSGPCHLHLKGSRDPYGITGHGAGFALVWSGSPRLTIAQPNKQYETIQMHSENLVITVPDLRNFTDNAATGSADSGFDNTREAQASNDRRMTKPCAQFRNGTRVGFGFRFERTCRPWNCDKCGDTPNLLRRGCRVFDFKPHNTVIMRTPEALKAREEQAGHPVDSYEGFRSDFIHFSISVVAPTSPARDSEKPQSANSMHFTPKGFAHFFAWWRLFDSNTSLPIRQGRLFPNVAPPSKKFGRSLATIKYRFDLAPLFISHFYPQFERDHGRQGHAQVVGVKARVARFRADMHQRAQERIVFHEKLGRSTTESHKTIYAADVLIEELQLKGMVGTFKESVAPGSASTPDLEGNFPKASQLSTEERQWFDYADFIDIDRRPFDHNPTVNLQDIGDCPNFNYSKRVKARKAVPRPQSSSQPDTASTDLQIETSKFGHELSHICLLGEAPSVGASQKFITERREKEIFAELRRIEQETGLTFGDKIATESPEITRSVQLLRNKARLLAKYKEDLLLHDHRHIDDNTLETASDVQDREDTFDNTYHIHCPRIYWNNASRNILMAYYYSSRGRRREDFQKSHSAFKAFSEQVQRLIEKKDDLGCQSPNAFTTMNPEEDSCTPGNMAMKMMKNLVGEGAREVKTFDPVSVDKKSFHEPRAGLPEECVVKPQHHLLMLKPQIALRSDKDDVSIVLLAAEEATFQGYAVLDDTADDPVNADVMQRNYANLKGLQGFYPLSSSTSTRHGPDFVPLEVLLDTRSEILDFERIILRTDASLHNDKFNHLRMRRGLNWPTVLLPNGQDRFSHLKAHQTMTMVAIPTLAVVATSRHYVALFNIVNDLLLYQDPRAIERTKKMESIMLTLDRGEGSTQSLLRDMAMLQASVRRLTALQRGYDMEIDRVTEAGKAELFRIKRDLYDTTEALSIAFEALASTRARADASAALKSSSKLEAAIGSLAWTMLQDNYQALVKVDVRGTRFSWLSNKDGSTDSAVVLRELNALNSDPEAIFPEIVSKHDSGGMTLGMSGKKKQSDAFAATCWSLLAPVGGITMVDYFAFTLHPLRFRMEERLGRQVMSYIFTQRNERLERLERLERAEIDTTTATTPRSIKADDAATPAQADVLSKKLRKVAKERHGATPHAVDAHSLAHLRKGVRNTSAQPSEAVTPSEDDSSAQAAKDREAIEMKKRASSNRTFIRIEIQPTTVVLSFVNDVRFKKKRKMGIAMPNVLDFKVKTPLFRFENKTWSMEDLLEQLRKELIQYVWHYKRDLVSQVFSNTDIFRSGKSKLAAAMESAAGPRSLKAISTSQPGLRYNVQPATPLEGDSPAENSSLKSPRTGSTHDVPSDEESLESPKRRGVRRFLKEKFQKNKDLLDSMPGQSTESLRSSPLPPTQSMETSLANSSAPNLESEQP